MFTTRATGALHLISLTVLLSSLAVADFILSPNQTKVCTATQKLITPKIVSRVLPVTVISMKVDSKFPFVHKTHKTVHKLKNITEYFVSTFEVQVCCSGYQKKGDDCVPVCPSGCSQGTCTSPSTCTCRPGWRGSRCTHKCTRNFFGQNCAKRCKCQNNAKCDPIYGRCACPSGFTGKYCNKKCPFGYYGFACLFRCKCLNNGFCDFRTGRCDCPAGLRGSRCQHECKRGTYGLMCSKKCNCKNGSYCDKKTGHCICPHGLHGENCSSTCATGFYGRECKQRCECENGDHCHPQTGTCHCHPGWQGATCSSPCSEGRFGSDCAKVCNCNDTEVCDPVKGCSSSVNMVSLHRDGASEFWTMTKRHLFTSFALTIGLIFFFIFFTVGILIGSMRRFKSVTSARLIESTSTLSSGKSSPASEEKTYRTGFAINNHLHLGQSNPSYKG